jgi:hypothetical protein
MVLVIKEYNMEFTRIESPLCSHVTLGRNPLDTHRVVVCEVNGKLKVYTRCLLDVSSRERVTGKKIIDDIDVINSFGLVDQTTIRYSGVYNLYFQLAPTTVNDEPDKYCALHLRLNPVNNGLEYNRGRIYDETRQIGNDLLLTLNEEVKSNPRYAKYPIKEIVYN